MNIKRSDLQGVNSPLCILLHIDIIRKSVGRSDVVRNYTRKKKSNNNLNYNFVPLDFHCIRIVFIDSLKSNIFSMISDSSLSFEKKN